MRVLDLFSGIGGFSLGLERAGMKTVAFCEIEPYCQAVLRKHWPGVPIYGDVRELTADRLAADGIGVDLICGGFPCQDLSVAGKGAGLAGKRSGLWKEYARLVGELRPRFVIVENVSALLGRGLGTVLGDLAALGYDAEWHCIPAAAVGAPHIRDRVWIVAYADRAGFAVGAHSEGENLQRPHGEAAQETEQRALSDARSVANGPHGHMADADHPRRSQQRRPIAIRAELAASECGSWWTVEPAVGRVVDGLPNRVDRLRALGNAVVPQIPEIIGRAIMNLERAA